MMPRDQLLKIAVEWVQMIHWDDEDIDKFFDVFWRELNGMPECTRLLDAKRSAFRHAMYETVKAKLEREK